MKKLKIDPGFILFFATICICASMNAVLVFVLSAGIHEAAHAAAIKLAGGTVDCLHLSVSGGKMLYHRENGMSYLQDAAIAAVGPLSNLISAFIAAGFENEFAVLFSGGSLLLGVFNLLPVTPFDGGRIVYCALCMIADPDIVQRALNVFSAALSGLLLFAGAWMLIRTEYNATLLIMGAWSVIAVTGSFVLY